MATIDSMNKDTTRLSDGPDWTFDPDESPNDFGKNH